MLPEREQSLDVRLRIVIADDHAGMLEWLTSTLRQEFEVVAAVPTGAAALDAVRHLDPDVIVLDLAMSPLNGLEVTQSLRESDARTAVVLITGYTDPELAKAAITAGALEFVLKSRLAEDLLPAVRNAGEKTLDD